jgi:flavin reductase (DIM6/NTAB) family NADH-FMN oxidoreductase RutF
VTVDRRDLAGIRKYPGEVVRVNPTRDGTVPRSSSRPTWHPADVDDYKNLMSGFPTGVAVVTGIGEDARPRGATCSSLCSVTLTPPTLLVCLKAYSWTLDVIRTRGYFAVNLLHARARHTAEIFSSPVDDRFANVPWRPMGPAGLPWLVRDAFAVAECQVADLSGVGDHTVVVGQVGGVRLSPDVPLLYGMRRFSIWTGNYPSY